MRRSKTRGASVEARLNGTTDRAYAIAEGRAKDFDWGRRQAGARNSLKTMRTHAALNGVFSAAIEGTRYVDQSCASTVVT